ncbi:hypothetical protein BDW59DRAFT_34561 [Aspergillus cavernicola]|uniref:Cyanovirin-N domain-containing protein n=1 Tax=Aspergillus cavernicola TaxID=176166 RepID=A0ABR4IPV9_9EURO
MSLTLSTFLITLLTLTGTTLAAPTIPTTNTPLLSKRFDLTCQDNGGGYRPVGEAQNCVDYLLAKGSTSCTVNGENVNYCEAGDTVISGSNVSGGGSSTSSCSDVALAAQKIIDSCTTPEGYVGGADAVDGNADIIVSINRG